MATDQVVNHEIQSWC